MSFMMNTNTSLQTFLDLDTHEEMMTYVQACGYLTALCISPETIPDQEWLAILFGENPQFQSDEQRQEIENALIGLKAQISRELSSEEELTIPCELDPGEDLEDSEINGWCMGFMEGVFLNEEVWFSKGEDEVSELLLPIMVGSTLFEEQPEFAEISQDTDLIADMLERIPELLTALYLLCNAPDEKPVLLKNNH
ncbi:YecA family protein [Gammaproteobacteria bacterium ESL0073]|nr:YecA family protein [Gammaproteobacteria bacterium ESL0073]